MDQIELFKTLNSCIFTFYGLFLFSSTGEKSDFISNQSWYWKYCFSAFLFGWAKVQLSH